MTIHIYAQSQWHDEAYIAAETRSLVRLRDAINLALGIGPNGISTATDFTEDGEGYDIHVLALSKEQMEKMALPYTDPIACEKKESAVRPWHVLQMFQYKKPTEGQP